ncbi:MAG: 4-hydroxybutyrate--acetyl-CoA CoA transferase [Oscillospiraceae bacterium]|nr:4-hydroxybutyrate--acetyl-CoA CoA transferase [Oscillospiraceae bacterium]
MSKYKDMYKDKLRSAREIIDMIQDGCYISAGQVSGSPQALYKELHHIKGRARDVTLQSSLALGVTPEMDALSMEGWLRNEAWFYGARERKLRDAGGDISYLPTHLSTSAAKKLSYTEPDMFWGVSAPMDKHGNLNISYCIAYEMDVLRKAKTVVLEVNENAPRTFGDNTVNIRDVDFIVESSNPRPTMVSAEPSEIDMQIGAYIASLVPDRATIQLGIGNIPNAVGLCLMDKKDLGVHTEMITSSMANLYEAGVITNKYKGIFQDKLVGTFVFGDEALYEFVDNNPMVELKLGRVVNDPFVIAKNENMVSINTAIQVDLMGQVSSEALGSAQYSGIGGQFDTAFGAQRAPGGKSIIALRSTAKGGTISTIVPNFIAGAIVTLPRNDVDHVVTEFGIAELRGRTIRERVKALIQIAHPDFRDWLQEEAAKLGFR